MELIVKKLLFLAITTTTFCFKNSYAQVPTDWHNIQGSYAKETNHTLIKTKRQNNIPAKDLTTEQYEQLQYKANKITSNTSKALDTMVKQQTSTRRRLDRADLQIGLSLSGDIGVLSASGSAALEMIWERKNLKKQASEQALQEWPVDIKLNANMSTDEIYQMIKANIDLYINPSKLSRRQLSWIQKVLYDDAIKIGLLVRNLTTMPSIANWYIDGFFKNYHFNAGGSLVFVNLDYSKRIRFRFKLDKNHIFSQTRPLTNTQKVFAKMMRSFETIARMQPNNATYKFNRVWSINTIEKGIDWLLFETSKAKGIQIEFVRSKNPVISSSEVLNPSFETETMLNPLKVSKMTQTFNSVFRPAEDYEENNQYGLNLSQLRYKFSVDKGFNVFFATVNKDSVLEYHFRR